MIVSLVSQCLTLQAYTASLTSGGITIFGDQMTQMSINTYVIVTKVPDCIIFLEPSRPSITLSTFGLTSNVAEKRCLLIKTGRQVWPSTLMVILFAANKRRSSGIRFFLSETNCDRIRLTSAPLSRRHWHMRPSIRAWMYAAGFCAFRNDGVPVVWCATLTPGRWGLEVLDIHGDSVRADHT